MKIRSLAGVGVPALVYALFTSGIAGEVSVPAAPEVAAKPKAVKSRISELELDRIPTDPARRLPWVGKPAAPKPAPASGTATPAPGDSPVDMSGDLVINLLGPFTREVRTETTAAGPVDKEVMVLTKKVEIEMKAEAVLRGEKVTIVRDIKTGNTELIDAREAVELVNPPNSKGRGESLRLETQYGANGEVLKNLFVLVGNPATGKKATLWMGRDVIQAVRFQRDLRLDTFRASGNPIAIIDTSEESDPAPKEVSKDGPKEGPKDVPKPDEKAPGKKAKNATGAGALDLSGGGKVSLQCEGQLDFDGVTGKLKLSHNVTIIKEGAEAGEGVRICCDDALITLDVPPPGTQPAGPQGALGGDMKMLECFGRVEMKTGLRTILCDKMTLDSEKSTLLMEMTNPADTVNVYDLKTNDGGQVMMAPKWLQMNTDTQELQKGDGSMKTKSFAAPVPSNRGNGPRPEDVKPFDPKAKLKADALKKKAAAKAPADAPDSAPKEAPKPKAGVGAPPPKEEGAPSPEPASAPAPTTPSTLPPSK